MSLTANIIGYKQITAYDGNRKGIALRLDKTYVELKHATDNRIYIHSSPMEIEGIFSVVAYVTDTEKTTIFDTYESSTIDYYGVTVTGNNSYFEFHPYTGSTYGTNIELSPSGKWGAYNFLTGYLTADNVYICNLNVGRNNLSDYYEFEGFVNLNKNLFLRVRQELTESSVYDWFTPTEIDNLIEIGKEILDGHYDEEPDPYSGGGYSYPTGTTSATFDFSSDSIDFPTVPPSTATRCGFLGIYAPNTLQLSTLNKVLWNYNPVDLKDITKMFTNIMDMVIGLQIIPSVEPITGSLTPIQMGTIQLELSAPKVDSQYIVCDMGTIEIDRKLGSYLDYSPYTRFQLYLPYCGTYDIDSAEILGGTLHVIYHIDIVSGNCVAYVKCTRGGYSNVLYQFSGNCSSQIPITSVQYGNLLSGAISLVNMGLTAVNSTSFIPAVVAGNAIQSGIAMNSPQVSRTGAFNGASSLMTIQQPYLIINVPKVCIPENQNAFIGYPSYINKKLSTLKGFNRVDEIHIENISATEPELVEIENILKAGVKF